MKHAEREGAREALREHLGDPARIFLKKQDDLEWHCADLCGEIIQAMYDLFVPTVGHDDDGDTLSRLSCPADLTKRDRASHPPLLSRPRGRPIPLG